MAHAIPEIDASDVRKWHERTVPTRHEFFDESDDERAWFAALSPKRRWRLMRSLDRQRISDEIERAEARAGWDPYP